MLTLDTLLPLPPPFRATIDLVTDQPLVIPIASGLHPISLTNRFLIVHFNFVKKPTMPYSTPSGPVPLIDGDLSFVITSGAGAQSLYVPAFPNQVDSLFVQINANGDLAINPGQGAPFNTPGEFIITVTELRLVGAV